MGYTLDGKTFKTVAGLCRYLMKKHGAKEVSGVNMQGVLTVYADRDTISAQYKVSPPKFGEAQTLTAIAA